MVLLLKIGLGAGIAIREAEVLDLLLPGAAAVVLLVSISLARPDSVYARLYEPLFRGLLSILMRVMGMVVMPG